jgi:hypothetical protein
MIAALRSILVEMGKDPDNMEVINDNVFIYVLCMEPISVTVDQRIDLVQQLELLNYIIKTFGRKAKFWGGCHGNSDGNARCVTAFITSFIQRVYTEEVSYGYSFILYWLIENCGYWMVNHQCCLYELCAVKLVVSERLQFAQVKQNYSVIIAMIVDIVQLRPRSLLYMGNDIDDFIVEHADEDDRMADAEHDVEATRVPRFALGLLCMNYVRAIRVGEYSIFHFFHINGLKMFIDAHIDGINHEIGVGICDNSHTSFVASIVQHAFLSFDNKRELITYCHMKNKSSIVFENDSCLNYIAYSDIDIDSSVVRCVRMIVGIHTDTTIGNYRTNTALIHFIGHVNSLKLPYSVIDIYDLVTCLTKNIIFYRANSIAFDAIQRCCLSPEANEMTLLVRRLVLEAFPLFDLDLFKEIRWQARRTAAFLAFRAVFSSRSVWYTVPKLNEHLIGTIMSFL